MTTPRRSAGPPPRDLSSGCDRLMPERLADRLLRFPDDDWRARPSLCGKSGCYAAYRSSRGEPVEGLGPLASPARDEGVSPDGAPRRPGRPRARVRHADARPGDDLDRPSVVGLGEGQLVAEQVEAVVPAAGSATIGPSDGGPRRAPPQRAVHGAAAAGRGSSRPAPSRGAAPGHASPVRRPSCPGRVASRARTSGPGLFRRPSVRRMQTRSLRTP
jgi:hypothetical protein